MMECQRYKVINSKMPTWTCRTCHPMSRAENTKLLLIPRSKKEKKKRLLLPVSIFHQNISLRACLHTVWVQLAAQVKEVIEERVIFDRFIHFLW